MLGRLGRNADDVIVGIKDLQSKGVRVVALDVPFPNDWEWMDDDSLSKMIINAVSSGIFTIPEIANQMGHSSIKTTMRYMNPNLEEIRQKVEML